MHLALLIATQRKNGYFFGSVDKWSCLWVIQETRALFQTSLICLGHQHCWTLFETLDACQLHNGTNKFNFAIDSYRFTDYEQLVTTPVQTRPAATLKTLN